MLEVTIGAEGDRFALVCGGNALASVQVAVLIQDLPVMPLAYQFGGKFRAGRRVVGSGGVAARAQARVMASRAREGREQRRKRGI